MPDSALRLRHESASLHEQEPASRKTARASSAGAPDEEMSVVGWIERLFSEAIQRGASDLHFEPFESGLVVRVRVDGLLLPLPPPPAAWSSSIASRVKVMANLDISEQRLPQDGRIGFRFQHRQVDLRVSTLSTVHGESIVVRVLDRAVMTLSLDALGMPADVLGDFQEQIRRPNGLIIVTGPTGSGKTTTLYSALNALNEPDLKLLTAEDPVEYEVEGVVQTPVNESVGLSFATALRAFLRQDPDVIMIGEIRDAETARTAIQAALTGHLVISTLHTQDAAGAVGRLVEMGIEPFLVASALVGVLAQRLIRRVCNECREVYLPSGDARTIYEEESPMQEADVFYRGAGCHTCGGTGFKGRKGVFECLTIDDDLRAMIERHAPSIALKQAALAKGMRTLRCEGIAGVRTGAFCLEDVLAST